MTYDFVGDVERLKDFKEFNLRCMNSRDVRFVGKLCGTGEKSSCFASKSAEVYVTLSGLYVVRLSVNRLDGTEESRHQVCKNVDQIVAFFKEMGESDLGKKAIVAAGLDDAIDVP